MAEIHSRSVKIQETKEKKIAERITLIFTTMLATEPIGITCSWYILPFAVTLLWNKGPD